MPIEFACEECGSVLRVPDGTSGKRSRCPTCKHEQEIPWVVASGQEVVASSKLSIPCPKCQHHLVCSPNLLGTRGQCKKCKHIFTISTDPVASESAAPALVFHCPKCQQLFEGSEEMRGRKGKCHVCKSVFMIELEHASPKRESSSTATSPKPSPAVKQTEPAPTVSPASEKLVVQEPALEKPQYEKPQYEKPQYEKPQYEKPKLEKPRLEQPSIERPSPSTPAAPAATSPSSTISDEDELLILEEEPRPRTIERTPAPAPTPAAKPVAKATTAVPIRFECTDCRGVMEVPGSTAGLETECPYCRTIQTIPSESTPTSRAAASSYSAPAADYAGSIYGNQATANQAAFDPLGGLDFGATNPYAAPAQSWSAPAAPIYGSGASQQVTVGKVLQLGFDSLFPSCLMIFVHVVIGGVLSGIMYTMLFAVVRSVQGTGETGQYVAIGGSILVMILMGVISAWLGSAMSRMALNAVRKKPFDFADALNPEGAFNSAITVALGGLLIVLVMYGPALLHMSTKMLTGMEMLMVAWIVLFIPVTIAYAFATSLALFAGADGESSMESLQTSMSLVFRHFGTALAVLILSGLISGALAIFTFGASYVVPIYMTAALYHLAKKNS